MLNQKVKVLFRKSVSSISGSFRSGTEHEINILDALEWERLNWLKIIDKDQVNQALEEAIDNTKNDIQITRITSKGKKCSGCNRSRGK